MSFLLSISMISNFSGSILNLASTWFDILCVLCVFVGNLLGLFAVRAIALWDHQHRLGLDQLIHLSFNTGHLGIWKLWDLAPHSSTSRCESDTHQLQHEEFFVHWSLLCVWLVFTTTVQLVSHTKMTSRKNDSRTCALILFTIIVQMSTHKDGEQISLPYTKEWQSYDFFHLV